MIQVSTNTFSVAYVCLAFPLLLLSADGKTDPSERRYGKGLPFTIQDLPDCRFRADLHDLTPAARDQAMQKLQRFSFDDDDIERLHVSPNGSVAITCSAPQAPKDAAPASVAKTGTDPDLIDISTTMTNVPAYHSKTGSANVLYMDFDGHLISGTDWNTTYNGGNDYDTYPFSIDTNYNTFTPTELLAIRRAWERLADDFAPFDINVTTEEPDIFTTTTAHALITRDEDQNGNTMPAPGAGGFAYIGVFGAATYVTKNSPALCYYDNHFSQWDLLAQTAAHEVGHNLNLGHDGVGATEYYGGHGSSFASTSWIPIMGSSGRKGCSQWSKGDYFNASTTQDDLSIIAGQLTYRTDDHVDVIASATPLLISTDGLLIDTNGHNCGVIEQDGDDDVFSFSSGVGQINIDVDPFLSDDGHGGHNLDVVAILLDAAGNLLVSNNPSASLDANLTYASTGGTYYVYVGNTGVGTPTVNPPSGYVSYGSLGQYFISGSTPPSCITVTAPNGGEAWFFGAVEEITWFAGSNGSSQVEIELIQDGTFAEPIALSTDNDGSYEWTIPSNLNTSLNYTVRITQLSDGKSDTSDANFTIVDDCDEFEGNFDGWLNTGDDDFDWSLDSGGTASGGTGPDSGSRGSTFYLYTEASNPNSPSKTALLEKSGFDFSDATTVRFGFDYHMYGAGMGTLAIDIFDGSWHSNLWTRTGEQHNSNTDTYSSVVIDLDAFAGNTNITVRFRGETGSDFRSDMAIDCVWSFAQSVTNAGNPGTGPNWWYTYSVIDTNATANDFAAATQGQLKHIASKARDAMLATLNAANDQATDGFPTTATLVGGFTASNNFQSINLGQLKYVAAPFYNWLIAEGQATQFPWIGAPQTNDYSAANIGQVKNVFSFSLP